MINEICPVQFIEGVNESAEYNTQNFMNLRNYQTVAIEYTPKFSYCLTKIEIKIAYDVGIGDSEFDLELYTDYKGKPSDIMLGAGKLITRITKELAHRKISSLTNWHKVDLNPLIVIGTKKYWISISSEGKPLELVTAVNGDVTNTITKEGDNWRSDKLFSGWQCMLRFYGRVIPGIFTSEV